MTEDDFENFVYQALIALNGTSEVAIELHFDELINDVAIEEVFKEAGIDKLPIS